MPCLERQVAHDPFAPVSAHPRAFELAPKGSPELGTLIEGIFERSRFLSLIRDFTVFGDKGSGLLKIIAGYHQFHAVRHAVTSTLAAARPEGETEETPHGASQERLVPG